MINSLIRDISNNKDVYKIVSQNNNFRHPMVFVGDSKIVNGEKALITKSNISSQSLIFTFSGKTTKKRTRTSIQVGINAHIEAGDFGSYTNHSCEPNSVIKSYMIDDVAFVVLITIKDVRLGEELCFDYATTETDLTYELKVSQCLCGAKTCRGKVKSFLDLSTEEQKKIVENGYHAEYMTEYICIQDIVGNEK